MLASQIFVWATVAITGFANLVPPQVVSNLQELERQTQSIIPTVNEINLANGLLAFPGTGPLHDALGGLVDLTQTANAHITQFAGSDQVTNKSDADAIYNAYRDFISNFKTLINTFNNKAGAYTILPAVGQPIVHAFENNKQAMDEYAIKLKEMVPSYDTAIEDQVMSLDNALEAAIARYSGASGVLGNL
ncbi:hypothetical protein GGR57DRAFT_505569 [Xylariaceae sp. FL1272]|nr:hypothetical protein GGR57DRAFT_505569 [Xylariaceae sp. FL1272]